MQNSVFLLIKWGMVLSYFLFPNYIFSQGFINYQAFIYREYSVAQPGSDLKKQMLPYSNEKVSMFVELTHIKSSVKKSIFNETHQDISTDEQGMIVFLIGSQEPEKFDSIPWRVIYGDTVILKVAWSPQNHPTTRITIDSSFLAFSPFAIMSLLSDSSNWADRSESSEFSFNSKHADTSQISRMSINGFYLDSTNQSLVLTRVNGNRLGPVSLVSLAKIKITHPNIISSRTGVYCKGDTISLRSGPITDTTLFTTFWFYRRSNGTRDTIARNQASLDNLVLSQDTDIIYRIERKDSIPGLSNYEEDILSLKISNHQTIIDRISNELVFAKFNFCKNDSIILPDSSDHYGSWSSHNAFVARIDGNKIKFNNPGYVTIGFYPYNSCPEDVFLFTCLVTSPPIAGTLSGTQAICAGSTATFSSTVSGGSWSSSAAGVATVNASTGVVTGVAAGTATITYTVAGTGGCANAIATRAINVNPNSASSRRDTICQGGSYTFGSQTLTNSGTYRDTIPSTNGCDSIITLNLVVLAKPQSPQISVSSTRDTLFATPGNNVNWYRNGIL
jgi:hypothetical protein